VADDLKGIRRRKRIKLYQQALKTPHCGPSPTRPPQGRTIEQDLLLWALSTHRTVKAQDGTGAEFGLIERMMPAGFASPPHIHHTGDEAFYVLEGEIRFQCGDKIITGKPGAFIYLPRQVAHAFQVGAAPARMLQFNTAHGEAGGATARQAAPGPLSVARMLALTGKYHIELMLPPRS
jgi:quercetin dioxygenase-like cupin family protein